MRKLLLSLLCIICPLAVCSQTAAQNKKLAEIEGKYTLVENGTKVRFTRIFEDLGKNRKYLLDGLTNFFRFRDGYQLNGDYDIRDENDTYIVTFTMNYGNVGGRANLGHSYDNYMMSNWRIDVKDNRVRVIVDLTDYTQLHLNKTGILVKQIKNAVPLCVVPPFKKLKKEKDNEMYAECFINSYYKTVNLFYYLGESFKMLLHNAPDASTDW